MIVSKSYKRGLDGAGYLTHNIKNAVTREHAISISAAGVTLPGLEAEFHQAWFTMEDGNYLDAIWHVQWKVIV